MISNWTDESRIPPCTIYQAFKYFLDITTPPSPLLLKQFAPLATNEKQRKRLEVLSKVKETKPISQNLLKKRAVCFFLLLIFTFSAQFASFTRFMNVFGCIVRHFLRVWLQTRPLRVTSALLFKLAAIFSVRSFITPATVSLPLANHSVSMPFSSASEIFPSHFLPL